MNTAVRIVFLGIIILILVDVLIFVLSLFGIFTSSQTNDALIKASLAIVLVTGATALILALSKFGK